MMDVLHTSPLEDQLIEELHPDWGHPDWLEFTPSGEEQERGVFYTCDFCGQEVLDGYHNRRTGQYSCRVEGDYDAIMAYTLWLDEQTSDEEPEEE